MKAGLRMSLRGRRGAGTLVGVVLVGAVGGAWLAAQHTLQAEAEARAAARSAGRAFASWLLAADRAAWTRDHGARLAVDASFTVTPAELRGWNAVPPGLMDHAGKGTVLTLGIMDEDPAPGVQGPVAFAVLEPAAGNTIAETLPSMRIGALEGGLASVAIAGGPATPMAADVPLIELGLGRPMAAEAMYAVADAAVPYDERVLARARLARRPHLNRMEVPLDMGGQDVSGGGAVDGLSARVTGDVTVRGNARAGAEARSASMDAAELEATEFAGGSLAVAAALLADRAAAANAVAAGSLRVASRLDVGSLTVTGIASGPVLAVERTLAATGTSSVTALAGEEVDVTGTLSIGSATLTGAYGPSAAFSGSIAVGSCDGC